MANLGECGVCFQKVGIRPNGVPYSHIEKMTGQWCAGSLDDQVWHGPEDLEKFLPFVPGSGKFFFVLPKALLLELGLEEQLGTVPKKLKIMIAENDSEYVSYCLDCAVPKSIEGNWEGKLTLAPTAKVRLKEYIQSHDKCVEPSMFQIASS